MNASEIERRKECIRLGAGCLGVTLLLLILAAVVVGVWPSSREAQFFAQIIVPRVMLLLYALAVGAFLFAWRGRADKLGKVALLLLFCLFSLWFFLFWGLFGSQSE